MPLSFVRSLFHAAFAPRGDSWGGRQAMLVQARDAFRDALGDVPPAQSWSTLDHIRRARSCHELWHLRAEVFSLVSRRHDQGEAKRRLGHLDSHFPSRPRRPGRGARRVGDGYESVPPP